MKNRLKNGFGIIEVLVALALLSIMAVGISSLLMGAMKSQKGIQAKDQQREVTAEVRTLLNNKTACLNSFGGGNPQTGIIAGQIKDSANVARYTINTPDKSGMLEFKEFKVDNWMVDAASPTLGTADLKIKLSKIGDVGSVKDIRPDIITLKIKRDAFGDIIECFSIGTQSDGFWQISPVNTSDIYYAGGNIGIGTNTPLSLLDIAGNLSVQGEIKISSTGAGCTPAKEGTQRYNSVIKNMEFCDGATWKLVGAPPPPPGWSFGGAYTTPGGTACSHINPLTGGYSCPAGYSPSSAHNMYYAWGACPNQQYILYLCWK